MPDRTFVYGNYLWYSGLTFLLVHSERVPQIRGKEFACYSGLEAIHGLQVYYADPYSSWQRG
ncbi:hypothetical protein D3C72_2036350 [compost metagenome]